MTEVYDPCSAQSHEDPYPAYQVLRDQFPVYFNEERSVWALSRYADVKSALRDWETFSSAQGVDLQGYGKFLGDGDFLEMDPPRQHKLRKVVGPRFQQKSVKELEGIVRALAESLVAALEGRTHVDLGHDFAQRLPALTICRILGISPADTSDTVDRVLRMMQRRAGEAAPSAGSLEARSTLVEFFDSQVADRRNGAYTDDTMGDLARAADSGDIDRDEVAGLCLILIVAGMETTASLLGKILHALAESRVSMGDIRDPDRRIRPDAIEEFLRHDSPVHTTREISIHSISIPAGQRILLLYASANRDPREFTEPDILDLRRSPTRNLAFGEGIHFCLGMPLARLESRVALEVILDRVPEFRIAGPVVRYPSHNIRGIESLPVFVESVC